MPKKREPGFKIPLPGRGDLCSNPEMPRYGDGRDKLKYARPNAKVFDFRDGTSGMWPENSPASAEYTIGLRKQSAQESKPALTPAIQPGMKTQ